MSSGGWRDFIKSLFCSVLNSKMVKDIAGGVAAYAAAEMAVETIRRKYNTQLTDEQCKILSNMIEHGIKAALSKNGQSASEYFCSAAALACPDQDTAAVVKALLVALISMVPEMARSLSQADLAQEEPDAPARRRTGTGSDAGSGGRASTPTVYPATPAGPVPTAPPAGNMAAVDEELRSKWGVKASVLREFPDGAKPNLLEHLTSETPDNELNCPISLEPIVENGRLSKGVAALVEHRATGRGTHVFLFKRYALDRWFAASRTKVNPLSRDAVDARDIFLLS